MTTPNKNRHGAYNLPVGSGPPSSRTKRRSGATTPPGTPGGTPSSRFSMYNKKRRAGTPSSDRYIPSRSRLKASLMGSMCHSVEKERLRQTPVLREKRHQLLTGEKSVSPINYGEQDRETVHQASFRRAMGAILHNEAPGYFSGPTNNEAGTGMSPSRGTGVIGEETENPKRRTIMGVIHPSLKQGFQKLQGMSDSHLAYHEQPMAGVSKAFGGTGMSLGGPRCFSFSESGQTMANAGGIGVGIGNENTVVESDHRINPFRHNVHQVIQNATDELHGTMGGGGFCNGRKPMNSQKRKIPDKPTKVLDAPDIVDDYYLNLISWSKDNILAVAMGPSVYIWNASSGEIGHVVTLRAAGDYVSSVSWSDIPGCSKYLAVGTHHSSIQLWDTEHQRLVRKLTGHTSRVSTMAWNSSTMWLTTGGRDSVILQHDHRCTSNIVQRFAGHRQEVCGLKWNEDGSSLASGGNENYLCVWDVAMSHRNTRNGRGGNRLSRIPGDISPRLVLTQHKAAVKALDWYPFNRGVLASGGGSADRTIKFWNTVSGTLTNSVDTGSQVCSLLWSKQHRELCSSHGFSENQLILWKYPSMTKIQEFKSHTARVLNMEMSPDGRSVVSVGADETLRFWDIFGSPKDNKRNGGFAVGGFECPGATTIR